MDAELARRMAGPQRHRLLQGYPKPGLMRPGTEAWRPYHNRPMIVGVLPHASCVPAVAGCGFCTFPHEQFRTPEVRATVEEVIREIGARAVQKKVEAVYFGGGTANLTPPDLLKRLWEALPYSTEEVTLEGVPAFFRPAVLDALPVTRISMGVQTFNTAQLERMGRLVMGGPEKVARALRVAEGLTTSADMLINLPHQTLPQMLEDLQRAVDLGFDQICLYHLVLFRGLGVPWARDREMLAGLPSDPYENWLACREFLLEKGYAQKSLTNFEKSGRYRYEECSYQPETYDYIGFGPSAVSGVHSQKVLNASSSEEYRQNWQARTFHYSDVDLEILYATRGIARLRFPARGFPEERAALERAGLVTADRLTVKGMFYADSVAGLLASRRVRELRVDRLYEADEVFMG